jgi:hypothetical protein
MATSADGKRYTAAVSDAHELHCTYSGEEASVSFNVDIFTE